MRRELTLGGRPSVAKIFMPLAVLTKLFCVVFTVLVPNTTCAGACAGAGAEAGPNPAGKWGRPGIL